MYTFVNGNNNNRILIDKTTGELVREVSFEQREKELDYEEALNKKLNIEKNKSHFDSFSQVNRENYLLSLSMCDKSATTVFLFFLNFMNKMNEVSIELDTLASALGVSKSTVRRGIEVLKKYKYIISIRSGNDMTYIVNPNIAWRNHGYLAEKCRFNGMTKPILPIQMSGLKKLYSSKQKLKIKK